MRPSRAIRPGDDLARCTAGLDRLRDMEERHRGLGFDELRRRVLTGAPRGWTAFVERYSALVYTLALRLAGAVPDREEAAQEIYLAAFERLAADDHRLLRDFRGDARFETYLFAVVRNEVGHHRRRLARDRPREQVLPDDPAPDRRGGSFAEAVGLDPGRVASIVREALDRLEPEERLVLRLRFREGVPLRRLAEIFGWRDTNAAHYAVVKILRKLDVVGRCRRALRWGEPEQEVVLKLLGEMLAGEPGSAGEAMS